MLHPGGLEFVLKGLDPTGLLQRSEAWDSQMTDGWDALLIRAKEKELLPPSAVIPSTSAPSRLAAIFFLFAECK
ncbi:hypothetical protein E4U55_005854 [Claviceps digitariae]|nr:hypothetical protein E4U55_005854 [Claviceps digitariae]